MKRICKAFIGIAAVAAAATAGKVVYDKCIKGKTGSNKRNEDSNDDFGEEFGDDDLGCDSFDDDDSEDPDCCCGHRCHHHHFVSLDDIPSKTTMVHKFVRNFPVSKYSIIVYAPDITDEKIRRICNDYNLALDSVISNEDDIYVFVPKDKAEESDCVVTAEMISCDPEIKAAYAVNTDKADKVIEEIIRDAERTRKEAEEDAKPDEELRER